ncbi:MULTISPECIES: non-ribosomal peptide synthetase [Paenibacillus]|uniref:Non-ribosomal peptide synthetase n=1 Tax=Paenibacillus alvei TaxID=44250 RepID=A0ABT4EAL6_PAEAL|nr:MULTISPECIES: non-ribosomal peptide synthetase [Paenibacillus]MCY9530150.1 non-ribosomal peptide synthetase [Paenibacillus alvei]SDF63812.1 fengycin family lipopeptide synthetase B [Paenibacillus sp. cl6col]
MSVVDIKDIYELTPMQEGILYHYVLGEDPEAYVEQVSLTIEGELNPALFEESLNLLIERHDALRTLFVYKEADRPLQVVVHKRTTSIEYIDVSDATDNCKAQSVQTYIRSNRKRGFDLEKDVLIRLAIIKLEESKHQLIVSYHHIIMDGWSLSLVGKELFGIYLSLAGCTPLTLDPVFPYGDYLMWLEEQDKEKAIAYWTSYLDGYEQQASVPVSSFSETTQSFSYIQTEFKLSRGFTAELEALAAAHSVTMSTVVHTIWGILLQKYNNTDDVVFGSVVSGRPPEITGIEQMIGLFINTVPLRVTSAAGKSVGDLLREVNESMLEVNNFNYLSLADIAGMSALKNHLIDHILVFENYPMDGDTIDPKHGLRITASDMNQHSNYHFDVTVFPHPELTFLITYNEAVYESSFIHQMQGHITMIASRLIAMPASDLTTLSILTDEEKQTILYDFNQTGKPYDWSRTLFQRFESFAEQDPGRTALLFNGQRITYEHLNGRANQLARFLVNRGVQKGDYVHVLMERSPLMVECILAIWKAGAAYIPMDVKHPTDRNADVIADAQPRLILSLSVYENLPYDERLVKVDEHEDAIGREPQHNMNLDIHIQDVAYALFTSGSTGKPKGVVIEHLGMLNHILAEADFLGLTEDFVFAQNANQCFDISVWQLFGALALGGTTAIYPDEVVMRPAEFLDQLKADGVTLLEVVPSYLTVLLDLIEQRSIHLPRLGHLFITGEPATPSLVRRWYTLCPDIPMVNAYGPAEASDDIAQLLIDPATAETMDTVPIGKPLANIRIYIVDRHMNSCPVGVQGEICVAGLAVGRGYLNNQAKTEEQFMDDPFMLGEGTRLYKTGDLGKWNADGSIEFCGRKDFQVKIRGFRIELSEIESRLTSHNKVKETAVLAWEEHNEAKFLCAYFTSDDSLTAQELNQFMGEYVPDYMIPAHFIQLDEMPLNSNGKVDRKRLQKPEHGSQEDFAIPATDTERLLVSIWQDVLGAKQQISIRHNFYQLGGHSLKAMVIVSRIYNELNVELGVKELFANPTIAQLAQYIDACAKGYHALIPPAPKSDYYALSAAQRRMYILHELETSDSVAYNMPGVYQIQGMLGIERLEQAILAMVNRHEILRTSFVALDGEPVQLVHEQIEFVMRCNELTASKYSNLDDAVASFIRPFDLAEAPLFRIEIVKVADGDHMLLFDMHHIISDGLSGQVFLEELIQLYEGHELPLPAIQYKDYAVWHNKRHMSGDLLTQEQYWLEQLNGELPVLDLPLDYRRPAEQNFEGRTIRFQAEAGLAERIRQIAARANTTPFSVLFGVFSILLSRYSGQEDTIVGSPVSGRGKQELQSMLGMFANTVAIRVYPDGKKTFVGFLDEVAEAIRGAVANEEYPFERLVEQLNVPRDASRNPVFDVMFSMFEQDEEQFRLGDAVVTSYPFEQRSAKFDLMMDAFFSEDSFFFELQYCTALFKDATAQRMAEHYMRILQEVCAEPDMMIAGINMLSATETAQIVNEFNATDAIYDLSKTVHERFEAHAARSPDRPALLYKDEAISYMELNQRANRIARCLRKRGLGMEDVAAVLLDRSPAFVECVLGIWKSQGAYVPMDIGHGVKRKVGVLMDSGAKVLITMSAYLSPEVEREFNGHIMCLDLLAAELKEEQTDNLQLPGDIHGLAYILFTSGSTGKPKGVMIEHLGMLNHILAEAEALQLGPELVFAQNANQCFDISVWQLFGPLALGGQTAIYPNELVLEIAAFTKRLIRDKVRLLEVVPTYLEHLMDYLENEGLLLPSLQYLMITGETVKPATAERWFRLCPGIPMVNAYGPAEAADDVSQLVIEWLPDGTLSVPIGKPIANMKLYIVDRNMRLCPVGVFGEIAVSGLGVGRGYIHDPIRTMAAFIDNPFMRGTRLYKTGDIGRWLPDGNIEFSGRTDFQVKIRGYRIELQEIEAVILSEVGVRETVVVAKGDQAGDKRLCAYLVTMQPFSLPALKERLQSELPDYMIPAHYIQLDKMPLLENGKISRSGLPEPDFQAVGDTDYTAPRNEVEELLVGVFGDVLGADEFGIEHHFFEHGGDSIKAIQIASKLGSMGYTMKVKDLFQNPQISKLAKHVKRSKRVIDQRMVEGKAELTPIQRWFFDSRFTSMHHWNQAVVLYSQNGFEEEALRKAWQAIVTHHDALRMTFQIEQDTVMSYNEGIAGDGFVLSVFDFQGAAKTALLIDEKINQIQQSIDLTQGPLIRIGLFKTDLGDHLAIIIHHLVIDGVSWRILFEDLNESYRRALNGEMIVLPDKTDSYLNWSHALKVYAQSKALLAEEAYWRRIEASAVQPLPKNFTSTDLIVRYNRQVKWSLSPEATHQLLTVVNKAYNTEINDILLIGLGMAVRRWTGHDQVLVCLEGHGREEILSDMNIGRTVGWFTTMYPVILDMRRNDDYAYQLKNVKETLRQVPNKGIGYGILRYLTPESSRSGIAFKLEPEIKFNYLGQFDNDINTEAFQASSISQGRTVSLESEREIALNIGGIVEDGILTIFIDYNTQEFEEATIVSFGSMYKESLNLMIAHCAEKETSEVTPSDVGAKDLSIDELDAILSLYEG